jgi:queuine tRNA-ribosyltransferase
MHPSNSQYIPIATSQAGLCLTAANWQEVKVETLAYYLDELLIKPGYDLLKSMPDPSSYWGWQGGRVLNASALKANREGVFVLTSAYDGSKVRFNHEELKNIIIHLKPEMVIISAKIIQDFPQLWDNWPKEIAVYSVTEATSITELHIAHEIVVNQAPARRYAFGNGDYQHMMQLQQEGIDYIECNQPANAAFQGQVMTEQGLIAITDIQHGREFKILSEGCACPSCSLQLTRAYLHHLFLHTPLLCQRFLIQHNIYLTIN